MIARIRDTIRVLLGRSRFERDMDEEMNAHIAMVADDLVARGMPRPEAERRARAGFGAVQAFKQEARAARGVHWLDLFGADLRHTVRALRRTPGYTAVALVTLALGIGGATAMFSLIDGLLFRPLPFRQPDQLVNLFVTARESCATYTPQVPVIEPGRTSFGGVVRVDREQGYGALRAIDVTTGERRWEFRYTTPAMAGVMNLVRMSASVRAFLSIGIKILVYTLPSTVDEDSGARRGSQTAALAARCVHGGPVDRVCH